jgi:integrase
VAVVKLRGVKKVSRKLASGQVQTYWYAWIGGPRLAGRPGSPEFVASYNEAVAQRRSQGRGTLQSTVGKFRASSAFAKLSSSSKRAYSMYLKLIEAEFGDMPLAALNDRHVRRDFLEWRDTLADTPRKADYAWTVLARVLSFAKDRAMISSNPCERGGRLYRADRVDLIWKEDHLDRLFAVASKEIKAAVTLALWTGQRQGDLLTLPWSAFDGEYLYVKQSKTGRRVRVPASAELRATIASLPKVGPIMLTSSNGRPWTSDGFRASFRKACAKAGIDQLTFHDLRGTAVTRLAVAGCTESEIAAITGHGHKDVGVLFDRHYLSRANALGESAISKLERGTQTGKRSENGDVS